MIRDYNESDAAEVLRINAACQPEVGPMDRAKLELFHDIAPFFKIVETGQGIEGLVVGLTEASTQYSSPNYRWFSERHESFAYVDRIALADEARGRGWGPMLYEAFEVWAHEEGKSVLTAEVNTVPDNPRSHRFHLLFGFVEVGRERPYGGDEEVAMYEKTLGANGVGSVSAQS